MIYLRVAQNIAEGSGWSFNSGDIFNSATSPIHAIFMAYLMTVGLPPVDALWLFYAAALIAGSIPLHIGLHKSHPIASFAAPLLIILWPIVQNAIGLETATMLALLTFTSLAFRNEWLLGAGLLAGMVALTRPEGILMGPILIFAAILFRKNWAPLLLGWTGVIAAWFAFSWYQFGSLFPHTATIKSLQSEVPPWSGGGPWHLAFLQSLPAISILFILAAFAIWRGAIRRSPDDLFITVLLVFGFAQIVGYSVLGAPVGYW